MGPSTITILGCEREVLGLFSQSVCCCVLSSADLEELGLKDGCDVGVLRRSSFKPYSSRSVKDKTQQQTLG
jgi:hypothetical protein